MQWMVKMREIREDAAYCLCYPVTFSYQMDYNMFTITLYFKNTNVKFIFLKRHDNRVDMNVIEPMY